MKLRSLAAAEDVTYERARCPLVVEVGPGGPDAFAVVRRVAVRALSSEDKELICVFMVTVELDDRDPAAELTDHVFTVLDHLRPAVALSPRGWMTVITRVPASSVRQAALISASAVEQATGRQAVHLSAMIAAEFEARSEWTAYNAVVSQTEAARLLAVGLEDIEHRLRDGLLLGTRIGETYAISRATVMARAGLD